MQGTIIKVGHPDPHEAVRRGITTQGVTRRTLSDHEVEKLQVVAAREQHQRQDAIADRRALVADIEAVADPAVRRVLARLCGVRSA